MKRRTLLLTTGVAFCTPLTGCLGGEPSNESPEPPEHCEPANPELELPDEGTLNENYIGGYILSIERQRYLSQTVDPENTSVDLSLQSVTSHGKGFVVDVVGKAWGVIPDYFATVSLRRTAPDNVTVESDDTDPFASVEPLQETIDTAQDRPSTDNCSARGVAEGSGGELEQLRIAFGEMEPDEDGFYYLQGEAWYVRVKIYGSLVTVVVSESVPEGVSVESVEAEQFDVKPLQDAIHEALALCERKRNKDSSDLSEAEYNQLKDAFEEMEPDEDGFYYLQHNEWYVAIKLGKGEWHFDVAPWAARYYVDDAQVRVTIDDEDADDPKFDDPTEGQVIVC